MVHSLRATIVVLLIGALHTVDDVATFRAVLPVAHLNLIGVQAFGVLYMPVVARLLARGERHEVARLFWQSTLWITVATFPIFAMTFSFARPTTLLLFGDRYESSASILVVLALGYYLSASFGLNVLTLKAAGRVKALLTIDLTVAAVNIVAMLVLIPAHGALGGAYATSGSLVLHNVLVQIALRDTTGLAAIPRDAQRVYVVCVTVALALTAVHVTMGPSIVVALILGACRVDRGGVHKPRSPPSGRYLPRGPTDTADRPVHGMRSTKEDVREHREPAPEPDHRRGQEGGHHFARFLSGPAPRYRNGRAQEGRVLHPSQVRQAPWIRSSPTPIISATAVTVATDSRRQRVTSWGARPSPSRWHRL